MIAHTPPLLPHVRMVPPASSFHRDLEVARYDHVPQGAPWLRAIVLEAARVAQVPAAALNLVKSTTQRTVAAVGTEATLHDRRDSMCGEIVDLGRTIHVEDASYDVRWADNPFVDGRWAAVRFYGSHPLVAPSGFAVGTLCVLDDRPRVLPEHCVDQLDRLAARAVTELEESRLAELKSGMYSWGRTAYGALAAPAPRRGR